jgi:hypothetical protein
VQVGRSIDAVLADVRRNAGLPRARAREIEQRASDRYPGRALAPAGRARDTRDLDRERHHYADPSNLRVPAVRWLAVLLLVGAVATVAFMVWVQTLFL